MKRLLLVLFDKVSYPLTCLTRLFCVRELSCWVKLIYGFFTVVELMESNKR